MGAAGGGINDATVAPANPFSNFINSVDAFFQEKRAEVIQWGDAFLPSALHVLEVGLEEIAAICGQAVLNEAPKVLSGAEKFGNAVTSVIQQVEAAGKTIALQTAQAGIQAAYLSAQKIAQAAQVATAPLPSEPPPAP